ncbi:hypothetical protein L7F22_045769 [Adiantum nelumboides]|nr:hypothetical protein [Adiantum nelumboides]
MDVGGTVSVPFEAGLCLGFLFRLFLWWVEMGLRARLDAMESHSTAQQWKRQRCFRATSGLASLCSSDGTIAHAPLAGCHSILENNYYRQKKSLSQFVSSGVVQRSALAPKIGLNKSRFLLDEASTFDPLGIVHVGSRPDDAPSSLIGRHGHHSCDFQLSNDGTSSTKAVRMLPQLSSSASAGLANIHASAPTHVLSSSNDCKLNKDGLSASVDIRRCSEKCSAATDMHASYPADVVSFRKFQFNYEGISPQTTLRMQRQPSPSADSAANTLMNMHASIPTDVISSPIDVSAAATLVDMQATQSEARAPTELANTHSNSREPSTHSGSLCKQQVHKETALAAREALNQDLEMSLTHPKAVTAPNTAVNVFRREPVYKQLLERRHADDARFKDLKSSIEVQEALLENLRRTKQALFERKKTETIQVPLPAALIPLSEEEEEEVRQALSGANRCEVLVQHEPSNIDLSRETLQCLKPGAWLNDEVINLYLELLKEREYREKNLYLKCHFFNTFFFNKLYKDARTYDYKAVRRWTSQKKLGYSLLECDKIFIPIHQEIHWCLAVINLREKKLQYLDSLKGQDLNVLQALARYIRDEAKDKGAETVDTSSWKLDCPKDIPEQLNGWCDII